MMVELTISELLECWLPRPMSDVCALSITAPSNTALYRLLISALETCLALHGTTVTVTSDKVGLTLGHTMSLRLEGSPSC